jgi:complex III assembly factor LYRM7
LSLELRITKDTELGDNDSIKMSKNINRKKKQQHKHTGGCCGGSH